MKEILIMIGAKVPDDISLDALSEVASAAKVQVEEPELQIPDDPFNTLTFDIENVRCVLVADGESHEI